MNTKDLDLMRVSPLFKGSTNDEIAKFLTCNYPPIEDKEANAIILTQGSELNDIILILKGEVAVEKIDYSGNSLVVDVLKSGDIYGQASVFGDKAISPMSLTTTKKTRFARFRRSIFYRSCSAACKSHENVIKNMMTLLANQTAELNKRVDCLATTSVKSKVARYLLSIAEDKAENETFTIPFNREELALYLGVQRPSLSRTLTQLADEGIISYHLSTFKITDLEALNDLT